MGLSSGSLAAWESSVGALGRGGFSPPGVLGAQDSGQGAEPDLPLWEHLRPLGSYTGLFHSGVWGVAHQAGLKSVDIPPNILPSLPKRTMYFLRGKVIQPN